MQLQHQQSPQQGFGGMNQILELFKMQYLMKFMSDGSGKQSIWTILILLLYDQFAKIGPMWVAVVFAWIQKKQQPPNKQLELLPSSTPPPTTKTIRACIQFERPMDAKSVDPRIDSVMYHVCNLPDVRSLRYNGIEMIPNFKDIVMIENDIWFEVLNSQTGTMASVSSETRMEPILYRLSTYDHDITWLHKFVEEAMVRYEQEKKNKLGSETYYFDQVTSSGGMYRNPLSNQICMFTKSKFQSNRSLGNVYLRQIDELKQRVEFFLRRRDWYDSKGIPHTLGIVMYGHPGCGKTSTIKAIANETKRHIFNIALSEIKTKEALKDLFYNDTVHTFMDGKMEVLNIPIKQRVYVIEDIDAMDSVVVKRTDEQQKKDEERKLKIAAEVEIIKQTQGMDSANRMLNGKEKDADTLDLATLLNVLDGVRETPGRIIVLSTNYPERLDEALLRPGRFDMMIEFEKHNRDVLKQHIEKYYSIELTAEQIRLLDNVKLHHKWTPAEVSQILFRRIQSIDLAIHDLIHEDPAKLFKFSQLTKDQHQQEVPPQEEKDEKEDDEQQGTDITQLLEIQSLPIDVNTSMDEKKKIDTDSIPTIIPIDIDEFNTEVDMEIAKTNEHLLKSSDELREHGLKAYKTYLDALKKCLKEEYTDESLKANWVAFLDAKKSMASPTNQVVVINNYDDDLDGYAISDGRSFQTDLPTAEQQEAARIVREKMESMYSSTQTGIMNNEPTFTQDSSERVSQYIAAVHTFEEAQDNFFQNFLTNDEPKLLDDYFKESLI